MYEIVFFLKWISTNIINKTIFCSNQFNTNMHLQITRIYKEIIKENKLIIFNLQNISMIYLLSISWGYEEFLVFIWLDSSIFEGYYKHYSLAFACLILRSGGRSIPPVCRTKVYIHIHFTVLRFIRLERQFQKSDFFLQRI